MVQAFQIQSPCERRQCTLHLVIIDVDSVHDSCQTVDLLCLDAASLTQKQGSESKLAALPPAKRGTVLRYAAARDATWAQHLQKHCSSGDS